MIDDVEAPFLGSGAFLAVPVRRDEMCIVGVEGLCAFRTGCLD